MEKYGVSHPLKREDILEKFKQTNIKKYGVPYPLLKHLEEHSRISNVNKNFAILLESYNIDYIMEYNLDNLYYDFYLPKYNLLIEINPTYTHSTVKPRGMQTAKGKDKNYHYNKIRLANDNGYICICIWDWINKENLIKAIVNNSYTIEKHEIRKYWNKEGRKEYYLESSSNLPEDLTGWLPVYDDGQDVIINE